MKFDKLTSGDRFRSKGTLWTKLDPDTARKHSSESIRLGREGNRYLGDSICSFGREEEVFFSPPAAMYPDLYRLSKALLDAHSKGGYRFVECADNESPQVDCHDCPHDKCPYPKPCECPDCKLARDYVSAKEQGDTTL
jgi:hypothetical protein